MSIMYPHEVERFTLFVILPWEEVCSVRDLPSGVTTRGLHCRLELLSGCPAFTYRLVSSDGRPLQDDQPLVVSRNVWDGYMVRVQPLELWKSVYDGVLTGNLERILNLVNTRRQGDHDDDNENKNDKDTSTNQRGDLGTAALFLAAWFGSTSLCRELLNAGVDPNSSTPFGRTAMFVCAVKDNDRLLSVLKAKGAMWNVQDITGETVLDVAKKNIARQCVNKIRSFNEKRLLRSAHGRSVRFVEESQSDLKNHHRKVKSARISVESNSDLIGASRIENKHHKTHNNNNNSATAAAPTMSSLSRTSKIASPRTPRYHSSEPAESTPRSMPGAVTLRVAPSSRHQTQKPMTSSESVSWYEGNQEPDICPASKGGTHLNDNHYNCNHSSVQCSMAPNGLNNADADSWRLIGRSCSPRHTRDFSARETTHSGGKAVINVTFVDGKLQVQQDETSTSVGDASDGCSTQQDNSEGNASTTKSEPCVRSSRANQFWLNRRYIASMRARNETLKTANRRIQLSETQKRNEKKRVTFEQWLKKKRRQNQTNGKSSDDDSDDSSDEEHRRKANIEAFDNWLKEIGERTIKQVNPNSAISLHKRKTRALQGLIEISNVSQEERNNGNLAKDISTYMHSYKTWLKKNSTGKENKSQDKHIDDKKAKKELAAIRNNVLAEALTFDEWMKYKEESTKMTKIISQSNKNEKSGDVERSRQTNSAKRNITFEKWKQELELKEAKRKIAQLRIRKAKEEEEQQRNNSRNSTAISHEAWMKNKVQTDVAEKQQRHPVADLQEHNSRDSTASVLKGRDVTQSPEYVENKQSGFTAWVNKKHEVEMKQIDENIQHEQKLLEQLKQKNE